MGRLITPNQAARKMGVHVATIYRWVKSGHLIAKKLPNGQLRIEPDFIKKQMERFNKDLTNEAEM